MGFGGDLVAGAGGDEDGDAGGDVAGGAVDFHDGVAFEEEVELFAEFVAVGGLAGGHGGFGQALLFDGGVGAACQAPPLQFFYACCGAAGFAGFGDGRRTCNGCDRTWIAGAGRDRLGRHWRGHRLAGRKNCAAETFPRRERTDELVGGRKRRRHFGGEPVHFAGQHAQGDETFLASRGGAGGGGAAL